MPEIVIRVEEGRGEALTQACKTLQIKVRELPVKKRPGRDEEFVVTYNDPIELFTLGAQFQYVLAEPHER